jgi:hypothetical protein
MAVEERMADEWVTVQVDLGELTDRIEPVVDSVDSVLSFLIASLNVVSTILDVIKTFSVGLLDPIQATVELILDEVRGILQDLRQLGVYLTGDWLLLQPENKFANLIGGYQDYERRMLARLLDRSDPNRPDFTSATSVVGVFFYASSEDINAISRTLRSLANFFGRSDLMGRARPFGTPTTPTLTYGVEGAGLAAFRQLSQTAAVGVPDAVTLTWTMPAGTAKNRLLSPAPRGFLIHASTIEGGFEVLSLSPKSDVVGVTTNLPRVQAAAIDPATGAPLRLWGGVSDLGASPDPKDFSGVENFDNPQAPGLVLQRDQNTPLIRPSTLIEGGVPLIGNTFFARAPAIARVGAGTKYSATFRRSDLPRHASFRAGLDGFAEVEGVEDPNVWFFRVRSLGEDAAAAFDNGGQLQAPRSLFNTPNRLYFFSPEGVTQAQQGVLLPDCSGEFGNTGGIPGFSSFSSASGPGRANLPSAAQTQYILAVQAAVALAILCRADLTEAGAEFEYNTHAAGQGLFGVEGGARPLMAWLGIGPSWYRGKDPGTFRRKLRNAMFQLATYLQQRGAPPEALAQTIAQRAEILVGSRAFRWSDFREELPQQTILQSIGCVPSLGGDGPESGLGGNPYCRTLPKALLVEYYYDPPSPQVEELEGGEVEFDTLFPGDYLDRAPAFAYSPDYSLESGLWVEGEGSADMSPIVYNDAGRRTVHYVRNVALTYRGGELLRAAAEVLQVAGALTSRPTGDTQWIAVRLMPQAFAPLDEMLSKLDRFLQGVNEGLQGIVERISEYIELTQARILQLQALLDKIRALTRALTFFTIPSVSALVVVESGVDGVASAFASAENKPNDSPLAYGAGAALIAGGIPSVLLELLVQILGGRRS